MNRKVILFVALIFAMVTLSSCKMLGGDIVDKENKNITIQSNKLPNPIVNIYYDTTANMAKYLKYEYFPKVVYSSFSAINDAWANAEYKIFSVKDSSQEVNKNFFECDYKSAAIYNGGSNCVVQTASQSIDENALSIIITDLSAQLNNYSGVSNALIASALSKGRAVAIVGVDTATSPFYMIVLGDKQYVSDYIVAFKNKPDIQAISGETNEGIDLDIVRPINYQILADKSGIIGIDYPKIDYVKAEGDFRKVIQSDRPGLDQIEGMVNFNPNPQIIKAEGEAVTNIGAMSLLKKRDIGKKYAGKVKLYIPFEIIEGVHLSTMDCTVSSELYISDPANKKTFKKYEKDYSEFIDTDVAEGVTPEQGKWRVDDKTDSLIFNITLPNAAKLPSGASKVKLDVTMEHYSTIDTLPLWVKEWDKTKSLNLVNMFSAVYNYQQKSNKSINSFTVYLGLQ